MTPYFDKERMLRILRAPLEVVLLRYIIGIMILVPTIMLFFWLVTPERPLNIVLIDKSVPDANRTEHAAFTWLLKQDRIVKSDGTFYDRFTDYYGFYPRSGGDFVVQDFSSFDSVRIDSLASAADLVYLADAYGVYSHNYGGDKTKANHSLYGGVNASDLDFIRASQKQGKTIIAEFSLFGAPTSKAHRDSLQSMFGLKWSGWIGRYFISLDTTANDVLPDWVVQLYEQNFGPEWPFTDSGVILVKGEEIVILEYGTHLLEETPLIKTEEEYAAEYQLAPLVRYPFWFDIVTSPYTENRVVSIFQLPVNAQGDSLLLAHKIPAMFPAVLYHPGSPGTFYYFAGDFSDNQVPEFAAYLKGISYFHSFFYDKDRMNDRRQFFWRFYRPLIEQVLDDLSAQP